MELVKLADFTDNSAGNESVPAAKPEADEEDNHESVSATPRAVPIEESRQSTTSLVYRIEIILPAVRDQAVYDAIFRSAKEHLLR